MTAGDDEMPVKRRATDNRVDFVSVPGGSSQANAAISETLTEKPTSKSEFTANRDFRAALEANPEAARALAKDHFVGTVLRWIIIVVSIVILYAVLIALAG